MWVMRPVLQSALALRVVERYYGRFVAERVTLLGSLWVAVLRHRVEEKTETVRATLESTGDGILVVNSDRKVATCNRKFFQICGISESAPPANLRIRFSGHF
jgi:PAS domain-containing protein